MSTTISYNKPRTKTKSFQSLGIGDHFVIDGHDVVYRKVYNSRTYEYAQLELETGRLWPATNSAVRVVSVNIEVNR